MLKITHIITGLNNGGAEMMLYKLIKALDKSEYDIQVVSMLPIGVMGERITQLGIPVHSLDMKRGYPSISALFKVADLCKNSDVIQSWMYHADLLSGMLKLIFPTKKVIWGVRHSNLDKDKNKKSTLIIAKIDAFISRHVDIIVSCSQMAIETHSQFGYQREKFVCIPNGFELDRFRRIEAASIVKDIENSPFTFRICTIGRWNIQKDYPNLIKAIQLVSQECESVKLFMIGTNLDSENEELTTLVKAYDMEKHVQLLGSRDDIPEMLSICDAYVSSSSGEGFSNVIGEAMACEVPCIVTDAGDSAWIVKDVGFVVPVQNHERLAEEILNLVNMDVEERRELGKKSRQRVLDNFDINYIVEEYKKLYI